jgi:hypothetical protein
MKKTTRKKTKERRKHKRFPSMHNLSKPIELIFEPPATITHVPAVLINLSAGGMGLLTFVPIEANTIVNAKIDFKGLKIPSAQGRVMWALPKDESWRIGIKFTRINESDVHRINLMAEDYNDCEIKLSLGAKDVCFKKCHYWKLCDREERINE